MIGFSVCCIYHKPKRFDESSDEDSSDSDSESSCDHGHEHHVHSHGRGRPGEGAERTHGDGGAIVHELEEPEPNAYEVAPGSKKGKRKAT